MQYSRALIFSKHTDLLPYFYGVYSGANINDERYIKMKAHYANERDVQLILLIRYEHGKIICRIKCPINPMPVRGEFVASDMHGIFDFLRQQGWVHKDTYNLAMFR